MAKGFLISGWRLRILDANAQPSGSEFPFQVAFFAASTQTPDTVYNDAECAVPIGPVVALDSQGYAPDNGVWGEVGKSYKAVVSRVLSSDTEIPDSERLETLYTINGISCEASGGSPGANAVAVSSMAALRLITPAEDGVMLFISGYYSANDGGQGFFCWSANSHETDDGGYSVRPDSVSSGEAGRFIRVLADELDVRWWGAIPDGVVDCVSPLSQCKAHAARIDLYAAPPRIIFPAGKVSYNLPGFVTLGGSDGRGLAHTWRIKDGAKFSGFTYMGIATPAIIETKTLLDDVTQASVKILPGVVDCVDLRWWGDSYSDLYNVMTTHAPGIPVYLDASVGTSNVLSFPSSSMDVYPGRIIIGEGLTLRAESSAMICFDSFGYSGQPRRLLSREDDTGAIWFRDMDSVPAWAFGWGAGDDLGGIGHALTSVSASDAVLHLNGYGVNGFPTPELATRAINSMARVQVFGTLSIGSDGVLGVKEILNGSGRIFEIAPGVSYSSVRIYSGQAKAIWFGNDGSSISRAVAAVGYGPTLGRTVDLCGKAYSILPGGAEIALDVNGVCVKDGKILCSAAIGAAIGVSASSVSLKELSVFGYANTDALISISSGVADQERITVQGCTFSCGFYGYGVVVGGNSFATSRVRVKDCVFESRASGSLPFLTTTMAGDILFSGCEFSNLYRKEWVLYGSNISFLDCTWSTDSTAASLLGWHGSNGFRFAGNRCYSLGLEIGSTADVVVERNLFYLQGTIILKCMSNGQQWNGVSVVDNRFLLESTSEWSCPIYVDQLFTVDDGGWITTVSKAFDWKPVNVALRIAENVSNMGSYMHQTEVSGRIWSKVKNIYMLNCLIPLSAVVLSHFSDYLQDSTSRGELTVYFPSSYAKQFDSTINCIVVKSVASLGGRVFVSGNRGFSWSLKSSTYEGCLNKTMFHSHSV